MTAREDADLLFADRSERAKLRFTGPQRAWFLHQIMTQSFDPIAPGEHRTSAMLTAHGRMVGFFEADPTDDAILAHMEPELRATFPDAIRRYVFATQVEIDDVSDDYGLVLVVGERWREAAVTAAPDATMHPTSGLGTPAGYMWVDPAQVADVTERLEGRRATEEEIEGIRVTHGVARWGRDMNERTIPQEARIEDVAVHFSKGCYVGQEAMAKIHFRGKVNRLLRPLEANAPVGAGADVFLDGAKVGAVTSTAGDRALAMLKHTVEPGTVVDVEGIEAKVTA